MARNKAGGKPKKQEKKGGAPPTKRRSTDGGPATKWREGDTQRGNQSKVTKTGDRKGTQAEERTSEETERGRAG